MKPTGANTITLAKSTRTIQCCLLTTFRGHWRNTMESQLWKQSEFKPVWPDLAKFRHFGKILQSFGKLLGHYFLFGKIVNLHWEICYITGLIIIVVNGQILKHDLTIWSHWFKQNFTQLEPLNNWLLKISKTCHFKHLN